MKDTKTCLFCENSFYKKSNTSKKVWLTRNCCSVPCSALYQWREYRIKQREKAKIQWIGFFKWKEYHALSTKKQIKWLERLRPLMEKDVIKNNKANL